MAVHTIRIESTADVNRIELRSAARWAGPGCTLRFSADGTATEYAQLEIDDRVVRLGRGSTGGTRMSLDVQVATTEDRLTLLTERTGRGSLVLSSEADVWRNELEGEGIVTQIVVLFLKRSEESSP
jgi:hypothetical protein